MNIQPAILYSKPAISVALSLSILLGLSACSDNTAVEDTAVSEPDVEVIEVVEPEAEVVEAEAVEAEVVEPAEVVEAEVVEPVEEVAVVEADTDSAAEPELLAANAGETLYNKQCMVCHTNGLLNSPILGDKAAWAPRIDKGIDTLTMHSVNGYNQMPAQAYNGVTEAQIRAAVEYMVDAVS